MKESEITTLDEAPVTTSANIEKKIKKENGKAVRADNADTNLSGKTKTITIHVSGEDGGNEAVFVGLNGYAYQIPRGTPCAIPVEVAKIIEDAVITTIKPGPDGSVIETSVPRFAYSMT